MRKEIFGKTFDEERSLYNLTAAMWWTASLPVLPTENPC